LENLKILCPNCHSQTENNGAKNIKRGEEPKKICLSNIILSFANEPGVPAIKEKLVCKSCGKPITRWSKSGLCKECADWKRRRVTRPSKEELLALLKQYGFCELGKRLGIVESAIRKWCRIYGLPTRGKAIKDFVLN
jgi:Zn finger protein HypA/HybF involved in hydrogenase expression